jgi:phage head maturation protease
MTTLTDNLIRSRYDSGAAELRDEGDVSTLFGHFSVFDTWTKISSRYEGTFLERVGQGSYTEAFRDKAKLRVLFEHGGDPSIGNKPIAIPDVLRQDDIGAYHESPLLTDASYVRDLIPALKAKQLGASMRFRVVDEEWVDPKKATDHNPEKLPERTIRNLYLYEYGPVTWGAYPTATSGVRSGTDSYLERLLNDPLFVARFTERAGLAVVERILSASADGEAGVTADTETPVVDRAEANNQTIQSLLEEAGLSFLKGTSNVSQ